MGRTSNESLCAHAERGKRNETTCVVYAYALVWFLFSSFFNIPSKNGIVVRLRLRGPPAPPLSPPPESSSLFPTVSFLSLGSCGGSLSSVPAFFFSSDFGCCCCYTPIPPFHSPFSSPTPIDTHPPMIPTPPLTNTNKYQIKSIARPPTTHFRPSMIKIPQTTDGRTARHSINHPPTPPSIPHSGEWGRE